MNKVKLVISGRRYSLNTPEDEQYLLNLAKILNNSISQLRLKEPSISLIDACILVGLDTLSDKQKIQESSDHLRKQVSQYFQEAKTAKSELQKAKEEIATLKQKLENLTKQN